MQRKDIVIKLGKLKSSVGSLSVIGGHDLDPEFSNITYRIGKNISNANKELETLSLEEKKLHEKFKVEKKDEKTNKVIGYEILPKDQDAYRSALEKLHDEEVTIHVRTIDFDKYPKPLSGILVSDLSWMFDFPADWEGDEDEKKNDKKNENKNG